MLGKPRLFTANGTLAELLALFHGYEMAWGPRQTEESPVRVLKEFWRQIDDAVKPDNPYEPFSAAFQRILTYHGSEDTAVAALREIASTFDPPRG